MDQSEKLMDGYVRVKKYVGEKILSHVDNIYVGIPSAEMAKKSIDYLQSRNIHLDTDLKATYRENERLRKALIESEELRQEALRQHDFTLLWGCVGWMFGLVGLAVGLLVC